MQITSEETASDQLRLSWQKYRAWAFVAAVTLVHLLIAARSVGPMYVLDEIGYLAGADVIGGQSADWSLCGAPDGVAYSAVLAPLWWLPVSPPVVYQIAALLSAALGALAMWPATALAKRFGANGGLALGIGALVTLVPARALMDNYVLTENPLTLLVLSSALLTVRLAQSGRRIDVVLLGGAAGLAATVDARAVPLVVITVAWIAGRAILRSTRWLDAGAASTLAIALTIGGLAARNAVGAAISGDNSPIADAGGHLSPVRIGEVILGQAFTQVVSWSLLTALGIIACVAKARGSFRDSGARGVTTGWWWLGGMVAAQAGYFVWVLASSAAIDTRFDIAIFGRYLDPFVVPLAVLGAVTLWVGARKRLATTALVASAIAVVAYGVVVVPRISPDETWLPFSVPGLAPFLDPEASDHRPALVVAGVVALVGCALLWLSRGRAMLGVAISIAVAAIASLGTDLLRLDPLEAEVRDITITSGFVLQDPDSDVTMAADLLPCVERNKVQFELAGIATLVPQGGDYGDDLIVGPMNWPEAEAAGLRQILYMNWGQATVWTVRVN